MGYSDKIAAVSRMQAYIAAHLAEEMTSEDLSRAAGYSKFHAMRLFRELTGRNVFDYIRALRLTQAARALSASGRKVIDVALETGFASHDGFTRAFRGNLVLRRKNTAGKRRLCRILSAILSPTPQKTRKGLEFVWKKNGYPRSSPLRRWSVRRES